MEVLKVYFEEGDFLLDLGEDNFVMGVDLGWGEDRGEEELVELSDLVDVGEQLLCLLRGDHFAFEQSPFEIWYDYAEVSYVFFFCLD